MDIARKGAVQWSRLCFVKCHHAHVVQCCAIGKGRHPLAAPSLFITLSFCFGVEMLEYTLPFPIILCMTWHNKALCGRSPGATVTLYALYTFWRNHRGINTAVFSLLLQCMNNHRKKLHSFNSVWECLKYKTTFI